MSYLCRAYVASLRNIVTLVLRKIQVNVTVVFTGNSATRPTPSGPKKMLHVLQFPFHWWLIIIFN